MRKYYSAGRSVRKEGPGPKGKRILGITDDGRYYLTNYGSGITPVDKERKKALGQLYDTDDPDRYAAIAKKFKAKQKAEG
jgi:hypothetical protein|tara:strand:+ start:3549 stop:3788 length:240 start_codon:yes stop_codon:yes gene_type:complete